MIEHHHNEYEFQLWLCSIDIRNVPYQVVYERDAYYIKSRDGREIVRADDSVGQKLWRNARDRWVTGIEMFTILCEGR